MPKPRVAIFGTNGFLGKPILETLISPAFSNNFQLPIIAVTRDATKKIIDAGEDKVIYKQADLADPSSLQKAFEGIDVLINTASPTAEPAKVLDAAIKGGAKLYFPSNFGIDASVTDGYSSMMKIKKDHAKEARATGIKTVEVHCSLFTEFLHSDVCSLGYDPDTGVVTFVGDKDARFSVTTLKDVGNTVAALASKDPQSLPDAVRIYSDLVTPEQVVSAYEKANNLKLKREQSDAAEELKKTEALIKEQGLDSVGFYRFASIVISRGAGYGAYFVDNDREFVNPGESVFKWGSF